MKPFLLWLALCCFVSTAGFCQIVFYGDEDKADKVENKPQLHLQTKKDFLDSFGYTDKNLQLIELYDQKGVFQHHSDYGDLSSASVDAWVSSTGVLIIYSKSNKMPGVGNIEPATPHVYSRIMLYRYLTGKEKIPLDVRGKRDEISRVKLPE